VDQPELAGLLSISERELVCASEAWLAAAGLDARPDDQLAADQERRRRVLDLLGERRTRTGSSRRTRVALCGAAVPCEVPISDPPLATWTRLYCRDRWCPVCARRRADELKPRLREWLRQRGEAGAALALLTLTRRRRGRETAAHAISEVLASWKTLTKRAPWRAVVGGLRALEVVARKAGDRVRHRGVSVKIASTGVHAHVHALIEIDLEERIAATAAALGVDLEGRPGLPPGQALDLARAQVRAAWWSELRAAWLRASPGSVLAAQDLRWISARKLAAGDCIEADEIAAYPLDGLGCLLEEVEARPERRVYAVEVLDALDGRRTLATLGTWRALSLRPVAQLQLRIAPQPLAAIQRRRCARWQDGELVLGDAADALLARVAAGPRGGVRELVADLLAPARDRASDARQR